MKPKHILSLIVLGVLTIVMANSLFVVQETGQAMVLTFGKVDRLVAEPGLHMKKPFIQQVMMFDKRILETDSPAEEVQAGDKKRVVVDSFTRWRITDARKFYEAVRTEFSARQRLNVIVNSAIRKVVARVPLADMISEKRPQVMAEILADSRKEAESLGIEVVDVRIKRADLPEQNARAVYQRMQAEREKEAKEIRAQGAEEAQKIRANAEKERTIVLAEAKRDSEKLRGEGDAQAIKIFAGAFNRDQQFYAFIRSLEAYRKSLKDSDTMMILDPQLEFFKTFRAGR